jgi:hypothetical protein
MAQALLKQRGMSAVFWGEAMVTAVYILNRSPTKAFDSKTLYKAWHERKPAVSHLRVFGYLAFAKELGHVSKLDDRSTRGVFIGYAKGWKAYRILDPKTQRVRTARDVVFHEGRGRGTRRWTAARLRLTTTSLSSTSTLRKLGEWATLLRRALAQKIYSIHHSIPKRPWVTCIGCQPRDTLVAKPG